MVQNYSELPADPPSYDDFELSDDENTSSRALARDDEAALFEEFDIEDPPESRNNISMLRRAANSGKLLAYNINGVIVPMKKILDPVYELYRDSNIIFDSYLARIGNPLILKRLIYVFSITVMIYIITASGIYPNKNVALYGDFYDPVKLNTFVESHINEKSMATTLKYLSSMPHIAGTAGDLTLARYIEETMHNNGLSGVNFYEVESFLNYANISSLQLMDEKGIVKYDAMLTEASGGDKSQLEYSAFNADSLSGEAKGHLVYANYGSAEDFKYLEENDVELEGKILLMRYGKIPASQKVEIASLFSAIGVLFISDPVNGEYTMDSIQRESVGNFKDTPGDVLTPGWPSLSNAARFGWDESSSTPKVVSLPISWRDALPLIEALQDKGIRNEDWTLTLDGKKYEMWTGHSTDQVSMVNRPLERPAKPVWNVLGRITGREQYDKAVVIGAQRDSSCFGTINPNTGTTILLELIRLFAKMQSTYNWSPLRTIYFISFDATEYNAAGATEFVESKMRELKKEAYAYIDLSDAVSGDILDIHSHPVFKQVLMSALSEVKQAGSNDTLLDAQFNHRHMSIDPIKDYSKNSAPFQAYLAVPAMELKFSGKNYPKNTCFDTYEFFEEKGIDKNMLIHRTLTELIAKVTIKLVEEPLIPFDLLNYVSALDHYLKDVKAYAETLNGYKGNELDSTAFISSVLKLKAIGTEYEGWVKAWREIIKSDNDQEPSLLTVNRWTWNLKLSTFESRLLSSTGIPNRPWYRNVIFGPQYWQPEDDNASIYEWATLPGVRDALREANWKAAREQLNFAADLLLIAADSFIG